MGEQISVGKDMATTPETVWALISDLPRMGQWSNENEGGKWLDGATGPEFGAEFRGSNRNGVRRWSTKVTVVAADPGSRFAFDVGLIGLPISQWSYDLEPTDAGCRVTETWTDRRPGWFVPFARLATGVSDRAAHTRDGMALTLERVAAEVESPAPENP